MKLPPAFTLSHILKIQAVSISNRRWSSSSSLSFIQNCVGTRCSHPTSNVFANANFKKTSSRAPLTSWRENTFSGVCLTKRIFHSVHGNNNYYGHRHRNRTTSPFTHRNTRLFGSKRITSPFTKPPPPPGKISIYDEQEALTNINIPRLERTVSIIRDLLTYPTYDVSLILIDDALMRETNLETRGVDAPTDILSFPFHPVVVEEAEDGERRSRPGLLEEPEFDISEYYNLGDMMIDVPYVIRRCEEDRRFYEGGEIEEERGEENQEWDNSDLDDGDRGVSLAMSRIYDPEERIRLLLVHGMLHLVGYDHIEDDDYELMVAREEEIIEQLQEQLKEHAE